MTWLRGGSEPRRRMRRALLHVRAQEISDETTDVLMSRHRTEVHARSRVGQSRLERRSPTRSVATSFLALIVGGGSGSTAGGLKITTLVVLLAAALAEVRGYRDVETLDRRIPDSTVRVAIAVLLAYGTAVVAATMATLTLTGLSLDVAQLEVVSALTTSGLDMGVVPDLPNGGQILLIVLMFLGRIGPLTLASSLTMTNVRRGYRLSEGRPMVG